MMLQKIINKIMGSSSFAQTFLFAKSANRRSLEWPDWRNAVLLHYYLFIIFLENSASRFSVFRRSQN